MSEHELPVHRLARWAEDGFPVPPIVERICTGALLVVGAALGLFFIVRAALGLPV